MTIPQKIAEQVNDLYTWIDEQIQANITQAGICRACGDCCDFTAYDHRLYVTSAELIAFAETLGQDRILTLSQGVCPYQTQKKCSMHPYRFSACRIFCCHGDPDFQAQLSEQALEHLKAICIQNDLPYRYMELKAGLEWLIERLKMEVQSDKKGA
jgi:hypothetical protein